ncbi:MAG: DNA/RNA nuclease SfsA [Myxococcota bacterium]|nr:DNA/RNA nuclease SfsA [Myxococcota bacterium]
MKINRPLIRGRFVRRYKRFFADIELESGDILTVHCPNSGSMKGCAIEGAWAWVSDSENPKRKLRHTLEIIEHNDEKICVNTQRPNSLVEEAVLNGVIEELKGYENIKREVRYGDENSRIDLLLSTDNSTCYVEVKNVTLPGENGLVRFPDSVTSRGTKHLRELMTMVKDGHRSVLVFCIARTGATEFEPAADIDPIYANTLIEAHKTGVEVIAYRLEIDLPTLELKTRIPVYLDR